MGTRPRSPVGQVDAPAGRAPAELRARSWKGRRGRLACIATGLLALLVCSSSIPAQQVVTLPAEDRLLEPTLESVYEVGGLQDAEPWEEFQSLEDAAFDADGRLYLVDGGGTAVVAVDGEGRLLHRLGGPGDGPGEYRSPGGVAVLRDGRVAVWDRRKRAFLLFGPEGGHLDEVRPDLEAGVPDAPLAVDPDGRILALAAHFVAGRLGRAYLTGPGIERARGSLPLLRIPVENDAPAEAVASARMPVAEGSPPFPVVRVFEPLPSWGPLGRGRIALVHSEAYRVEILRPDGSLERALERPLEARPTTAADREAFRRLGEADPPRVLGSGGGRDAPRAEPPDPWFNPVVPPVLEITADGDDRIWVLRRDPDDPTRPGPVDLLSAEGRYLGTLPRRTLEALGDGLPDAFGPDGLVVFLATGPLDVPVARVRRLPEELR